MPTPPRVRNTGPETENSRRNQQEQHMRGEGFSNDDVNAAKNWRDSIRHMTEGEGAEEDVQYALFAAAYNREPPVPESSTATHYIYVPPGDGIPSTKLIPPHNVMINADACVPIFAEQSENSGIVATVRHKSLVVVEDERLYPDGRFHLVTVVDTHPDVDGASGYIRFEDVARLDRTPPSLPMVFDRCQTSIQGNADVCNIATPLWYHLEEPYFNEPSCEYYVNVLLNYRDTGFTEETLNTRMQEAIYPGVVDLLEYYGKANAESVVQSYLSAFRFAEATSWHIDNNSRYSKLQILVVVPAKYFDAIPKKDIRPSDVEGSDNGVARVAVFDSSQFESQIDGIVRMLKGFESSQSWQGVRDLYFGPGDYPVFDFYWEAVKIDSFFSTLTRFLSLNGYSLRQSQRDRIEIGFDDSFAVKYIFLDSGDGAVPLQVGFNKLQFAIPFNSERTMAYVFYLYEMDARAKGGEDLTWNIVLQEYTVPPPVHHPSADPKKCKPTLLDPYRCVKLEFGLPYKKSLYGHLTGCGIKQKGESRPTWEKNKKEAAKTEDAVEKEDNFYDKAKLRAQDIANRAAKIDIRAKHDPADLLSMGGEVLVKLLKDVFDCGCAVLDETYEELLREESDAQAAAVRAFSVGLGCEDVCKVFPIACGLCIPPFLAAAQENPAAAAAAAADALTGGTAGAIVGTAGAAIQGGTAAAQDIFRQIAKAGVPGFGASSSEEPVSTELVFQWPPKIPDIPELPVEDIMEFVALALKMAIIAAIKELLFQIFKAILDKIRFQCPVPRLRTPRKEAHLGEFDKSIPPLEFEGAGDPFEQNQRIRDNFLRNDIAIGELDPARINAYIREINMLLDPSQFCELIQNSADYDTLLTVQKLTIRLFPDINAHFSNIDRLRHFFVSVGDMVDPALCAKILQLDDMIGEDIVYPDSLCTPSSLRSDILDGRLSPEQARAQLMDMAQCQAKQLDTLKNFMNTVTSGGSFFDGVIGPMLANDANSPGLVPRDPPSIEFLNNETTDTLFQPVVNAFDSDMAANIPTMITTEIDNSADRRNDPVSWIAGQMGGNVQAPPPAKTVDVVADNIREKLVTGNYLVAGTPTNLTNIINVEFPERSFSIKEDLDEHPMDINSNWIVEGFVKGSGIPKSAWENSRSARRVIREKRFLSYDVCTNDGHWSRVKDRYGIALSDVINPNQRNTLIAYSGEKLLKYDPLDRVLGRPPDTTGPLRLSPDIAGAGMSPRNSPMPTPAIAFNNMLKTSWRRSGLTRSERVFGAGETVTVEDILGDAERNFFRKYHTEVLYKTVVQDMMKEASKTIANSNLLSNNQDGAFSEVNSGQFSSRMAELQLTPDPVCDEQEPNLLNVPAVRSNVSKLYQAMSGKDDRHRYVESAAYGLVELYTRVFIIEIALDAIFVATQFRTQDIFGDDAFVKYLLYRLRKSALDSDPEFFIDMMVRVQKDILRRKLAGERFKDPFTGQEVMVATPIQDMMDENEYQDLTIADLAQYGSSIYRGVDDLLKCGDQDSNGDGEPIDDDCEEITEDLADAQVSDGEEDLATGLPILGYFEFFIKENLKSVSDEFEVKAGTEIYGMDNYLLNTLFPTVNVPSAQTSQRFFKNVELDDSNITEESLRARGLNSAALAYNVLQIDAETTITFSEINNVLPQQVDQDVQGRYEEAREALAELRAEGYSGTSQDQLIDFLTAQLRTSFFTEEKKSNLVKDEFQGLVDGGFILEKFIKITDYAEDAPEWQRFGQNSDLAVEAILGRGRNETLKGIVNLGAWEKWLSQTITNQRYSGLGFFTEVQGKTTINVQKFWANWEYGLRLVYVYPLLDGASVEEEEREEFEQTGVHGSLWDETTYFKNTFMGVLTNGEMNPIRAEVANREKAYILNESVGFAVNINLGDDVDEGDNIDITSDFERASGYRVATSPVATVFTSVRPEDIETLTPPPAVEMFGKVILAFETNVWNDVRDEYNRKRGQILQMAYEPDHSLKQDPSKWCLPAYEDEYDQTWATSQRTHRGRRLPGVVIEYFSEIHGENRRWIYPDIHEADLGDMCARYEELKAEVDLEAGPLGTKYARLSELYNNLITSSMLLAGAQVTLDQIRDHENGQLFIDTIGAIVGELQAMLDSDEVKMPCFGAQNPDFENRRSDFACAEYDRLAAIIREMEYYRKLARNTNAPPPINIKHGYATSAINVLKSDLKQSDEFKSLFEYIFPMKRFLTILTIYNAEYIGGLPGRREMFDTTKGTIRTLQATLLGTLNKDWWREKPRKGKKWWERSLALPVPMIILMTPFQILQMLLALVPPLDWILGGLLRRLPKLPPHRSKKPKSARCLPPPSRRGE